MTLTKTNSYTTSDGRNFIGAGIETRQNAAAHQKLIDRTARIEAVLVAEEIGDEYKASTLASIGDRLLEALTVVTKRGPNKPKVAA